VKTDVSKMALIAATLTNNSRSVVKIKTLSSHVIYDRFKTPFGGLIEYPINSRLKLDWVKKIKKKTRYDPVDPIKNLVATC
jgi:hypothetical protein